MKPFSIVTIILALGNLISCSSDKLLTQEDEQQLLNAHKIEIETIVSNLECSEESDCAFIAFGSKACGGPQSYLLYNSSIDTDLLISEVNIYNQEEHDFNLKWGIISDCMAVVPPTSVECIGGSCTAFYN